VPLPVQVAGVDPNVAQTAQAALQRNSTSTGVLPNGVSQVSALPIASPQAIVPAPVAMPPQATIVVVPELPKAANAVAAATPVAPASIATQTPASVVNSPVGGAQAIATIGAVEGTQPISSSAASINPAATLPTTNTILENTTAASTTEPASQSAGAALPAAPSNSQVVVPKVNVAASSASEDSRIESRWSPFNWLLTGLLACFGWLIVSSFLAVAVGRYLKGRQ